MDYLPSTNIKYIWGKQSAISWTINMLVILSPVWIKYICRCCRWKVLLINNYILTCIEKWILIVNENNIKKIKHWTVKVSLFEPPACAMWWYYKGAQLDKTKMEQIFLLFQCSLLSWKGCLSFINCTVSQSVSVYSPGLVTSSQFPPASALTSAEAVLAWAGLNTQGRERGEEGGRREAILIIMSTWNLQEQQSEETLWAALSAISR